MSVVKIQQKQPQNKKIVETCHQSQRFMNIEIYPEVHLDYNAR